MPFVPFEKWDCCGSTWHPWVPQLCHCCMGEHRLSQVLELQFWNNVCQHILYDKFILPIQQRTIIVENIFIVNAVWVHFVSNNNNFHIHCNCSFFCLPMKREWFLKIYILIDYLLHTFSSKAVDVTIYFVWLFTSWPFISPK